MILKKLLPIALIIYCISACVDPFNIKYKLDKSVLSIDAQLTNIGEQIIILTESQNEEGTSSISISGVNSASVTVIVNKTQRVLFNESKLNEGYYIGPKDFVAEIGKTYQLEIIRLNGIKYLSDIQELPPYRAFENSIKAINQIDVLEERKFTYYTQNVGFHNIYLDFEDKSGLGDNYSWTWTLYEANSVCKTCGFRERYSNYPYPGDCSLKTVLPEVYDYYCDSPCWKLYYSTKINIFKDEFSDGNIVKNRLIAKIPLYQYNQGALIQIKQQLLSKAAYQYQKLILDQNDNSGGLADTPPSTFFSNITPEKPSEELIAGHFNVCFQVVKDFWIDRRPLFNRGAIAVGLLEGRFPNSEKAEPGEVPARTPPLAPCLETYTSTKIRPKAWRDPE